MQPFNGERHLRLVGERLVLDGGPSHGPWSGDLQQVAGALLAAAVIDSSTAEQIVDDYQLATIVRSSDESHRHAMHRRRRGLGSRPATAPVAVPRAVVCERTTTQPWGEMVIHSVQLSGRTSRLEVTLRLALGSAPPRPTLHRFRHPSVHPPTIVITDDRGVTQDLHFSGGGSDAEWTGYFQTATPLPIDTTFVEVAGERIDLPISSPAPQVRLEAAPGADPLAGYVWGSVARAFGRHGPGDLDVTLDTLVTCGALEGDDPLLQQAPAVCALLGLQTSGITPHPPSHHSGATTSPEPPEPWAGLVASTNRPPEGPIGTIPVGASTPVFDGVSIGVLLFTSDPHSFTISVITEGLAVDHDPLNAPFGRSEVIWWARDDRGGTYLGGWGEWHADEESASGEIMFPQPLDPAARWLDLMPTGPTTRAVITIPLSWPTAGHQ